MTRAAESLAGDRHEAPAPQFDLLQKLFACCDRITSDQGEVFVAYPNTQLFIDGKWRPAHSRQDHRGAQSRDGRDDRHGRARRDSSDLDEALAAAAAGFKVWRAVSAFDRCKIMRKAAAIMRERNDEIAPLLTMEQGKTLAEAKMEAMAAADVIEWFAEEAKRAYGRHHSGARAGHLSNGHQGAGRSGRGLYALEFPDQPGGAQALRRAGLGMLDHRQGAGGNPGLSRATDPRLCGRRRAGWRDQSGLWRAVGDFGISDPASGHPQNLLHRLDRGRQAIVGAGRIAHEARHHGIGRPCAGDRFQRRGRDRRRQKSCRRRNTATPARSAFRRPACWCRTMCSANSSTSSSRAPNR